jgi:CrcB protein
MPYVLLVAVGGATGAVARYLLSIQITRALGTGWPYGTLAVNLLGGFLMGVLVGVLTHRLAGDEKLRVLLGVGMLGGFTTFSAYSLELALMIGRRAYVSAATYGAVSVVGSVTALFLGLLLMRRIYA